MLQRQTLPRHIPYKKNMYVYVSPKQLPNREAVKSSRDYYRKSSANPLWACPARVHRALVQAGPAFWQDTGRSADSPQGPAHWLWEEAAMQWKSNRQEKIQQCHPEKRAEWDTGSKYTKYRALSNLQTGEPNRRDLKQDIPKWRMLLSQARPTFPTPALGHYENSFLTIKTLDEYKCWVPPETPRY